MKWGISWGGVGKGKALFQDQSMQSVVVLSFGCMLEFPELLNIFIIRPDNKLTSNFWVHAEASVFSNIFKVRVQKVGLSYNLLRMKKISI